MDDGAGEEEAQNPPFIGRWMATSSYDVYMVDAPKENRGDDKEEPDEDEPPEIQPKHRRHAAEKTTMLAPVKIILRAIPRTMKTWLR